MRLWLRWGEGGGRQALKECHKAVSPNVDSLENELADKIGKQQRARMSSLQACRCAALRRMLRAVSRRGDGR